MVFSCNTDDADTVITPEPDNKMEQVDFQKFADVNQLFIGKGNKNSDTVIIFEQGGPVSKLNGDDIEIINDSSPGLSNKIKNYYRVYAHQGLTFDTKNSKTTIIDKEEALRLKKLNTDILQNLILHFKSLNKKVIWGIPTVGLS
ncbi:hypothetical protein [Aquimarina agarivorans]|uniref:hypothetical protein n=1 Tax=Aquimarina agarivorans TaxID=980584 RepID=UPI000248ED11|nr:hypothetical protein [Aquimarina agarivorans]